jgi:hypothetical protein
MTTIAPAAYSHLKHDNRQNCQNFDLLTRETREPLNLGVTPSSHALIPVLERLVLVDRDLAVGRGSIVLRNWSD